MAPSVFLTRTVVFPRQVRRQLTTSTHPVPKGYAPYVLTASKRISADSKLLRFSLPSDVRTLGAPLPSCVKVSKEISHKGGEPFILDKSYSPVSLPDQEGYLELVVKGYPPRVGGGLGAFLVGLEIGESAFMKVKDPRLFHGAPYTKNRWSDLGFVAGGTGIAPMLQMIRTILSDPEENTRLSLVFANRREDDILMRDELDALVTQFPSRFRAHYVLSCPPEEWNGGRGWVSLDGVKEHLPVPGSGTMVMVCGADQFLETVCGMTVRGSPPPGKKKGPKLQGELTGVLSAAGYEAKHVYKF
eukprot:TRINITY_DN73291_c0_g1_i1.p1 TRINITY_DN73291_c0_g1~~TRINITY_DN73291_c0_g1_i1.p1  ORF type:complete len:301 (+),score=19.77 TRINITY_DN73291_c0_g1_i1:149-1051(+)